MKNVSLSKGAFIYGNVQSGAGQNLKGVTIVATAAGEDPAYAVTDAGGDYAIYGLVAGKTYFVFATKRGYERQMKSATAAVNEEVGNLADFDLTPPVALFNLSGTVTSDCDNSAVAGAKVIASYSPGANNPDYFKVMLTDENGDFAFSNLPQNANYKLVVVPPGNLPVYVHSTPIDGTVGGTVDQDVVIPCGSSISGTAVGAGYVLLYKSDGSFVDFIQTADDGTYSFDGLSSATTYKVAAIGTDGTVKWYNGKDTIDLADTVNAGSSGIDISLQ